MEGNVDKLVVTIMKNQGMSWSLKGIHRLLCIRFLVLERKLTGWLAEDKSEPPLISLSANKPRKTVTNLSAKEPDAWVQAGQPVLHGHHASLAWVSVVRVITEFAKLMNVASLLYLPTFP